MTVNRSLASSLGWLVVSVLAVSATLPSCGGKKHYGDDDDDDDSSSGAGGGSSNGIGSKCDAQNACATDLKCTSGVCIPKTATGSGGTT